MLALISASRRNLDSLHIIIIIEIIRVATNCGELMTERSESKPCTLENIKKEANMKMDTEKILIIQILDDLNNEISNELTNTGCAVISTTDIEQGLKKAIEIQPEIIIMDTDHATLWCLDACRIITQDNHIKSNIIVLSCRNDLPTKLTFFMAGANKYITKPFNIHDLLCEIMEFISQKKIKSNQMPRTVFETS
jgi:response regulator RpfG family c-di-GMP phosphodiesterase